MLLYYNERGQGLVEYAFLLSFIVLVVLVVLVLVGGGIENLYNDAVLPLVELF
jgi:Flp pilus assembly pilin Flp